MIRALCDDKIKLYDKTFSIDVEKCFVRFHCRTMREKEGPIIYKHTCTLRRDTPLTPLPPFLRHKLSNRKSNFYPVSQV